MALMIRSDPAWPPLQGSLPQREESRAFRADGRRTGAMTPEGDFPVVPRNPNPRPRSDPFGVEIRSEQSVEFPEYAAFLVSNYLISEYL